jgi:tRNA A58 N-methylase Trm61
MPTAQPGDTVLLIAPDKKRFIEPWLYLDQVVRALADGSSFGSIVPTANQVTDLLYGFRDRPFVDIEVAEVLLRQYKPVPPRLRPMDHLMAHTGYLVFARKVAAGLATADVVASDAVAPDIVALDAAD